MYSAEYGISFKVSKLTLWNFNITLELFIDHLKVPDEFETSDLDLNHFEFTLQDQRSN